MTVQGQRSNTVTDNISNECVCVCKWTCESASTGPAADTLTWIEINSNMISYTSFSRFLFPVTRHKLLLRLN